MPATVARALTQSTAQRALRSNNEGNRHNAEVSVTFSIAWPPTMLHCQVFFGSALIPIISARAAEGQHDTELRTLTLAAALCRTQDEPSYCGLASLAMILNALAIDPK